MDRRNWAFRLKRMAALLLAAHLFLLGGCAVVPSPENQGTSVQELTTQKGSASAADTLKQNEVQSEHTPVKAEKSESSGNGKTELPTQPNAPIPEPDDIIWGSKTTKGFLNDNTLSSDIGDIHFSSYIPESYDGSEPYALFITLPGWEGLYFQGAGANMAEDFGPEAIKYREDMIVLSPQLDDWGRTSAEMTVRLTEYFLEHYNIDPNAVYLEGFSGGGETGSLVMGIRPELYTAYLMVSSKWDGDLEALAKAKSPVYMAIGEADSYYGSAPLKEAYQTLHGLYEAQGLSEGEIDKLLVLDVKDQTWFSQRGLRDQYGGGGAFAYEESIMGWLFGEHEHER